METISYQKEVKAIKDHVCSFCSSKIRKGEKYQTSTHKNDGDIYAWKSHNHCDKIADRLKMYTYGEDWGLTREDFQEIIHGEYFDLLVSQISKEDIIKYEDIIKQLHNVRFNDKLNYVIRHYAKIDKNNYSI